MERAYNPQTGEYVFLVNNEWVKPTQTAQNPNTGERAFLVGNQWEVVPGQKAAPAAPAAPALNVAGKPILAPAEPAPAPAPQAPIAPGTTRGFDISAMPEQFKSGVAGMQQSWFTNAAKNVSTNLDVMNRIDKGEKVPDVQDPLGYQYLSPEQRAQIRAQFESTFTGDVAKALAYNAEQQKYVKNPTADAMIQAANKKDWGGAWKAFSSDPAGVIQQLSVQSAPNALPSLIGGAAGVLLRGGVPALMAGLGTGSFPVEYMSSLVDSLHDAGVDMKDASAVEAKLRDPKFLEAAGKKAVTRGVVIAAADAASGKLLMPLKPGQLGKNVARSGANIATEVGTEMGGELGAQVASGETIKWGDVIAEGLGAGPQAVAQTALKTIEGKKKPPEEAPEAEAEKKIEPTLDLEALARGEIPKQFQQEEAEEVEAITQDLIKQNIPADNARRIATRRVEQMRKQIITDLIAEPSDDPVRIRAKEHIDAGMDPVEAINRARVETQEEFAADEGTEATQQGAPDVRETVPEAGGVSPTVAGQPGEVSPAPGVGGAEPTGVVSAGPDVTGAPQGAGVEPVAVSAEDQRQQALEELQAARQTLEDAGYDATPEQHEQLTAAEQKYAQADEAAKADFASPSEDAEAQQAAEQTVAAIEQETPKAKRGRKPLPLTEEEKTQKDKATKEYKRKYSKGVRDLDRATAELGLAAQPIDEEQIADEEGLKEAQAEKRASLVSAIRNLLSVEKNYRGTPLGNKAKALLNDRTKISEKDFNDIKKGWEATQHSRSLASSRVKPNTMIKGKMSANAVLNAIAKTGTPFERMLANRLRRFLTGVTVQVVEAGDPTPDRLKLAENYDSWDHARGVYMAADNTGPREVYLRGASFGFHNGTNNVTALHELLHAALNHRIGAGLLGGMAGKDQAQLVKLTRELTALMENAAIRYGQMERNGVLPPALQDLVEATLNIDPDTNEAGFEIFELPQEFLAYGLSDPVFQQFLMGIEGRRTNESAFSRFVQAILQFLNLAPDQFTALSDLINITDDMLGAHTADLVLSTRQRVSRAAKQPEQPPVPRASVIPEKEDEFGNPIRSAKKLARDSQVAQAKVQASREGEVLGATEQLFKSRDAGQVLSVLRGLVANNWQNMSHSAIDKLVRMPTMTFLAEWSGVKSLKDIEQHMQNMVGMANSLTASTYDLRQMLAKELNPFFRSAKEFRTKFENLVYESTLARYDPSNLQNKVRDRRLDEMWKDIGVNGRRMYTALQQHYENLIDLYSDLLDQQIENLQGLEPEAKKNLMVMLRAKFETGARIKPYFPLVRYGDYWLRVSKGDFQGFYMFETVGDRNAFKQQLADEMREDSDNATIFESGDTVRSLRDKTQNNSQMLKEVFAALDEEKLENVEALKDAIYQIYLNTMPEQSFRDMFIHRKDRPGFSTDVLRNVSASASKMSMQLARLKYAPMLRNSVSAAYDATQGNSNLTPFAKEAERRANVALSGNTQDDLGDALAGVANKASYFWFLSSAASALIQPASIYITSLPVIGANHRDMLGAAKELGKMVTLLNQYSVIKQHPDGTTSLAAPSLANSQSLNAREQSAVREMFQRGVSQSTYTALVWGYKNLPTRSASTVLGKAKEMGKEAADLAIGALMHNTERLTREATFLASYRLGFKQNMKRGMTETEAHQAAINQAVSDVNESLANYDMTNRPRWMQQGIGRVLFQFKMFPLHTALLLTTNFFKMLPFFNKEGKAAAAKKFFGIYLTAGSIAGAVGVPFFSSTLGAIAYAFKHMQDEDDDLPDELKDKDAETWFRTVFLPDLLGDVSIGGKPLSDLVETGPLNFFTGLAISERIGLNDLFGRDTKEAKSAREGLSNWALEKAGPTVSLGLSMADAYDAYQLGDFQKGAEKLSPAVLRNILLAERMAKEGIKDSKGNVITPPDEAKGYAMAQAIGFRPADLAKTNENNFKYTAVEQRIKNERDILLGRMKVQARKMDDEGALKLEKIFNTEVARFNKKNPEYAIDSSTAVDSIVKDLETRASARLGFVVTLKNARLIDPSLYRMEQRLEKLRAK